MFVMVVGSIAALGSICPRFPGAGATGGTRAHTLTMYNPGAGGPGEGETVGGGDAELPPVTVLSTGGNGETGGPGGWPYPGAGGSPYPGCGGGGGG